MFIKAEGRMRDCGPIVRQVEENDAFRGFSRQMGGFMSPENPFLQTEFRPDCPSTLGRDTRRQRAGEGWPHRGLWKDAGADASVGVAALLRAQGVHV